MKSPSFSLYLFLLFVFYSFFFCFFCIWLFLVFSFFFSLLILCWKEISSLFSLVGWLGLLDLFRLERMKRTHSEGEDVQCSHCLKASDHLHQCQNPVCFKTVCCHCIRHCEEIACDSSYCMNCYPYFYAQTSFFKLGICRDCLKTHLETQPYRRLNYDQSMETLYDNVMGQKTNWKIYDVLLNNIERYMEDLRYQIEELTKETGEGERHLPKKKRYRKKKRYNRDEINTKNPFPS